jgi:hypothetical protein
LVGTVTAGMWVMVAEETKVVVFVVVVVVVGNE